MSDFERVKQALKMVWKHKIALPVLTDNTYAILAETAVKTMWLIEEESNCNRPGVE